MKILIGMTRSDTILSGSFKHIFQVGTALRDQKHEVIYIIGGDGIAYKYLLESGFKVYSVSNIKKTITPFYDFLAMLDIVNIINIEKPDGCSWHTAKIGALGRFACFLLRKKSIYVPHGVSFVNTPENKNYKKYAILEKIMSYLPAKIIGVCDYDVEQFINLGVDKNKLKVIKNGMKEINDISNSKIGIKNKVKFITAARFEKQKDYETLAKVCNKLEINNKSYQLDIYGDGPLEHEVRRLFNKSESVNFKEVVKDFSIPLKQSDVFVLSSNWEGLPRSIIEAMSCKKPIIATNVGGVNELVDFSNGFLCEQKNELQLYNAMNSYIDDYNLIDSHGEQSLSKFKKDFILDKMIKEYIDEYVEVFS